MSLGKMETVARPLYQQVAEILTEQIAEGQWKSGQLLPSEPKLAQQLGVSPGTVRKALDQLAANQLVTRHQGKGTFVSISTREEMMFRFFRLIEKSGRRTMPESQETGREVMVAGEIYAPIFNISPEDKVVSFQRLRQVEGVTMMIEHVVLPQKLFQDVDKIEDHLPTTLYDFYEQRFGVKVIHVDEEISARLASEEEAQLLSLKIPAAVMTIRRTAQSFNGQVIELRDCVLNPENHAYLSQLS
ncbi:MAG: GntR family transcriptional regulator [Alphaproteobacteria bacterium]|nr:GntR family transcriptional regulator [Alphaproteobacteria bacterium]